MEAVACRVGTAVHSLLASGSRVSSSESWRALGGFHSRKFRAAVLAQVNGKRDVQRGCIVSAKVDAQREALQSLSSVVTDDAVPEGHKGLHGFLYGEGGAEVHGSAGKEFKGREGEDDGSAIVAIEDYVAPRESFKFAGVFAIYDSQESLQYVSYSRNVVSTLKSLRGRVGQEKCSAVRVRMYTEAALITRAKLEEEKQRWLDFVEIPAPGNSSERGLWEGAGNNAALMSEQEKIEYEEKKLKMRKAMGENLFDDVEGEEDDTRTRRLKLLQAVEGDDWSSVIDGQTKQTIDPRVSGNEALKAENSRRNVADEPAETAASEQIVSPFASNGQAGGGLYSAETYDFTVENVDKVLDEVRPYLIADGGNVEVVSLKDGVVSLRLQGACGTCPSSTSTMKMGIERVLMEKFGDLLKEVVQVDKQEIGASIPAIDAHLEMLRPAIRNYGGSVEVVSVDTMKGECQVKYQGPAPIGMGIQAAIKDKFPDIKQVELLPVETPATALVAEDSTTADSTASVATEDSSPSNSQTQPLQATEISNKESISQPLPRSSFQPAPVLSWIAVTLGVIVLVSTAYFPQFFLGPLEVLRLGMYKVGPAQTWQSVFYVVVLLHVLEAAFALYLARKVDPQNQVLWFWQTFYLGLFSLSILQQKAVKQNSGQ